MSYLVFGFFLAMMKGSMRGPDCLLAVKKSTRVVDG